MSKVKQYNISKWDSVKANYWGITKSGNTSVKFALLEKENVAMKGGAQGISQWVHKDDVTEYIDRQTALNNGYKNFTVVRNPYERTASMYKDFQRRKKIFMTVLDKRYEMVNTFDNFLGMILSEEDKDRNEHFRSQSSFIVKNGIILPAHVFDISQMERLNEFLGINIPHINKIDKKLVLTDKQIDMINKIYPDDFSILKYKRL